MPRPFTVPFVVTSLALAACGHARFTDGVFHGDPTYRITPPGDGYRRVDVEGANDLAFSRRADGAVLQINARCDPALDIPLVALTNHLLFGFTDREYVGEPELRTLDGREALFTHVRARLDGVPRELMLVVVKKNECVYDFAVVAAPGDAYTTARADLDGVLAGFSTEGRR